MGVNWNFWNRRTGFDYLATTKAIGDLKNTFS